MKSILAILFSVGLPGMQSYNSVQAQVLTTDSLALVALYQSTNGPNWTNRTNWLVPGRPVNTWYGVKVLGNRVVEINMNPPSFIGNNLVGSIPTQIGSLTALTTLDLAWNKLSGPIPAQIGNISSLNFLNLSHNQLTGSIPSALGNLFNLSVLLLNNNQLSGSIPAQLGNLSSLFQLNFIFNQLTGTIPQQLGNLSNLSQLLLDSNQLTGTIPSQFGNLTNLILLSLGVNQLSGPIPASFGNLVNLEFLRLNGNLLSGSIPKEIGAIIKLRSVSLNQNQFNGEVPKEFGNLTSLQVLLLQNNQLSGDIPAELAALPNLFSLQMQNNFLTGLPSFNKATLTTLNVHTNNLTFEDLEPNIGIATFTFVPQRIIPGGETKNLIIGNTFSKSFSVGGSANLYQWKKNGVNVAGATGNSIVIPSVDFDDAGTYELFITSPLVPGLTLQTEPTVLTVTGIPAIDAKSEGNNLPSGSILTFDVTEVGNERFKDLEITNTGSAELIITDIVVTGDFNLITPPPSQIDVNASTILTIRFSPNAVGTRTGTLTIVSSLPDYVFNLTGEGDAELEIFNVVTTNLNGKHDFLHIKNIHLYPQNRVTIYDRWGNQVFEREGYDNNIKKFSGISDKGVALPEGTYYYVIDIKKSSKPLTGFLFLRKN